MEVRNGNRVSWERIQHILVGKTVFLFLNVNEEYSLVNEE